MLILLIIYIISVNINTTALIYILIKRNKMMQKTSVFELMRGLIGILFPLLNTMTAITIIFVMIGFLTYKKKDFYEWKSM